MSRSPDNPSAPTSGSRLVTLELTGTQVFGKTIGPVRQVVVRVVVTLDAPVIVTRVDGKPLGHLASECREQIEAVCRELEQSLRRPFAPRRTAVPAMEDEDHFPASDSPAETSVTGPHDEKGRALARMAEIREQHWRDERKHPSETLLAPVEERPPSKVTSSIFRVDREVITDRINRLRRKNEAPPLPPPSSA